MKCSIDSANIRVFGKAVHALSKMGDALYFECDPKAGMTLGVVNPSRSAYMSFAFDIGFFTSFDFTVINDEDEEANKIKCKIEMHPCVAIFKSLANIHKLVDTCSVKIDDISPRVTFQLECQHGIVKTFTIPFLESDSLQTAYHPENCQNALTASAKLLAEAFSIFHSNQEEVTLVVDKKQAELRSYTDGITDPNIEIYSQLRLQPEEFDEYTVTNDTGITFCLKEIKALLSFTEMLQQSIVISFDHGGKPIIFTVRSPSMFKVTFVMATVSDENDAEPEVLAANSRNTSVAETAASKQQQPLTKDGSHQLSDSIDFEPQAHCSGWQGNNPVGTATSRTADDDANETEESEPPTVKRFKSLFLGKAKTAASCPKPHTILASDTEEEPDDELD